jgi:hypothetical protein
MLVCLDFGPSGLRVRLDGPRLPQVERRDRDRAKLWRAGVEDQKRPWQTPRRGRNISNCAVLGTVRETWAAHQPV